MKGKLDKFGQGRETVISELVDYCDKEMQKIKDYGYDTDTHIRATMTGQFRAFIKVKQQLVKKNNRLTLRI